jgi:hypothetical protein
MVDVEAREYDREVPGMPPYKCKCVFTGWTRESRGFAVSANAMYGLRSAVYLPDTTTRRDHSGYSNTGSTQ